MDFIYIIHCTYTFCMCMFCRMQNYLLKLKQKLATPATGCFEWEQKNNNKYNMIPASVGRWLRSRTRSRLRLCAFGSVSYSVACGRRLCMRVMPTIRVADVFWRLFVAARCLWYARSHFRKHRPRGGDAVRACDHSITFELSNAVRYILGAQFLSNWNSWRDSNL